MFQTWRSLTENKGVCNKGKNGDGLVSTDRSVVPRLCPLVMDNINIPFQQPGNNDLVVEAILCLLHMYTDCGTQKIQLILAPLSFLPPPPTPPSPRTCLPLPCLTSPSHRNTLNAIPCCVNALALT